MNEKNILTGKVPIIQSDPMPINIPKKVKDPVKVKRGRNARAQGAKFELLVRKDLEEEGWIVDKWSNQVEFSSDLVPSDNQYGCKSVINGKIVPAKHKLQQNGIPFAIGTGFPDFSCIAKIPVKENLVWENTKAISGYDKHIKVKDVDYFFGVECKMNGKLSKIEKEKCKWYLDNKVFRKILIAEKTKVKGKIVIVYHDFEEKYGS